MASEVIGCIGWIIKKAFWSLGVLLQFILLRLLDLLGLFFNLLACLTVYRFPCMVQQIIHLDGIWEWRYIGFLHCLIFVFLDIPCLLMILLIGIVSFFSLYYSLFKQIRDNKKYQRCDWTHRNSEGVYFSGLEVRGLILEYFLRLLVDIFLFPMGLALLCSWRSCRFIREMSSASYREWPIRLWLLREFLHLVADVFCGVFLLFVMLTWRSVFLWFNLRKKLPLTFDVWNKFRWFAVGQFFMLLLDIVQLVAAAVVVLSWRSCFFLGRVSTILSEKGPCATRYDVQNPDATDQQKRRQSWRNLRDGDLEAKSETAYQFFNLFADIPFILLALFVVLSLVRIPSYFRTLFLAIRCYKRKDLGPTTAPQVLFKPHKFTLRCYLYRCTAFNAAMVFYDVVCILCFVLSLIFVWRSISIITSKHAPKSCPDCILLIDDSKRGFAFRVTVIRNFLMIIVDIIALGIAVILLVTLVRVPSLVSSLINAKKVINEFAITVFIEFGTLLIDIVFVVIFLVLFLLRPLSAWTCLLEDDAHRTNRLLRYHLQWLPEMIQSAEAYQHTCDDIVSFALKNGVLSPPEFSAAVFSLQQTTRRYVKKYEKLAAKVSDHEEFCHLIQDFIWVEKQRPALLATKLKIELEYINHPNSDLHRRNLSSLDKKLREFSVEVSRSLDQLKGFPVPNVPLYEDSCGLLTRTRAETQKILIEALPRGGFVTIALILLDVVFLYRAPSLACSLYNRWYARREIALECLKQYLLDLATLLQFILVTGTVILFPSMFSDVYATLVVQRSWRVTRKVVARYPPRLLDKLGAFFSEIICTFVLVRFLVAAVLLLLLGPADLILTILKPIVSSKCLRYLITGVLHVALMAFPFVLLYGIVPSLLSGEQGDQVAAYAIIAYLTLLLLTVILGGATMYLQTGEDRAFFFRPPKAEIVQLSWSNINVIFHELLEFAQLLALILITSAGDLQFGETVGVVCDYLLLNFIPFYPKIGVVFALFAAWYLVYNAPNIFDIILERNSFLTEKSVVNDSAWRFLLFLFSNTLFVTVSETLVSAVACTRGPHGDWVLTDDPNIQCWTPSHTAIAAVSLIIFFYYLSTAILSSIQYLGEQPRSGGGGAPRRHTTNELECAPMYEIHANLMKTVLIGVVLLLHFLEMPLVTNSVFAGVLLVMVVFTPLFKPLFGYPVTSAPSFLVWRLASFVYGLLVCVLLVVGEFVPAIYQYFFFIAGGLLGGAVVVCTALTVALATTTDNERERRRFLEEVLKLEASLLKDGGCMSHLWGGQSRAWRRVMAQVRHACEPPPSYECAVLGDERGGASVPLEEPVSPVLQMKMELTSDNRGWSVIGGDSFHPPEAQHSVNTTPQDADCDPPPPPAYGDTAGGCSVEQQPRTTSHYVVPDDDSNIHNLHRHVGRRIVRRPTKPNPFASQYILLDKLELYGAQLLLCLEMNILYSKQSLHFAVNVGTWRSEVETATDWAGLNCLLSRMSESLDSSFNVVPRRSDRAVKPATPQPYLFDPDTLTRTTPRPVFVELTDQDKKRKSDEFIQQFKNSLREIDDEKGELWVQVFDRILPSSDKTGFIKNYSCDSEKVDDGESSTKVATFEFELYKPVTGVITKVGPKGVGKAKGAKVMLKSRVSGHLSPDAVHFEREWAPVANKVISLQVTQIMIRRSEKGNWAVGDGKYWTRLEKLADTLQAVHWK